MRYVIVAACVLFAFAKPVAATCTVARQAIVPATFADGKIWIPVTINETVGLFLLDTGASETLVDSHFADRAGVGMDRHAGTYEYTGAGNKETLPVFKGHVRMTHIGDIHFQDWLYGILDMSGSIRRELPQATGILGMDFMHYFDIEVDFAAHTVSIYRLSGCKDVHPVDWTGDYDAIPVKHTPSQNMTIPVFLDDAFLDVEFDTGWGGMPEVTRSSAAKAGVSDAAFDHDPAVHGGGIAGQYRAVRHRFKTFLIGSGVYQNENITISSEPSRHGEPDGFLGLDAFQAQRVWISFTTNTLYVQGAPKLKTK